jgi:hypothetical protein
MEGVVVAAAAIILFFHFDYEWWLLLALALAPDLSLCAFAAGPRAGAAAYNAAHTYVLAVALATAGVIAGSAWPTKLGLIWLVHIGVDRAVGYGLKYPRVGKETHLQRV